MIVKILRTEFELKNNIFELKKLILEQSAENGALVSLGALLNVKEDTTYFVDNLNLFYVYLIEFLKDNEIEFDYSYKAGVCSNVKLTLKKKIVFVNYEKKFGVEFSEDSKENWLLIDYAMKHHRTRISIGADAYNEFLLTIFRHKDNDNANHKLMRETFPVLEHDSMLEEAKRNVAGFQMCKRGMFNNVYDYDISSSYASNILNDTPCGLPYYFDALENVPKTYFKIIKFTYYNCKLKSNGIDFVKTGVLGTLVLPERLFEQFKANYDARIKIQKICAFKTRKSLFNKFIKETIIQGKMTEKNKRIASYNKILGNAVIGYLGRNTKTTRNLAKKTPNGLVLEEFEEDIEPIYLPAYLCCLDHAKSKFIRTLRPFYKSIIYANTDGFMSTEKIPLDLLNIQNSNQVIGNFRLCHEFETVFIASVNGYAGRTKDGEIENCISGMTVSEKISPEQFSTQKFDYVINERTNDGRMSLRTVTGRGTG